MLPVHEAVVLDDDGRTLSAGHECSQFEVREALRRLQRRFDLRPSGRLDDDTRTFMSLGRCGNTDTQLLRQRRRQRPETAALRRTGSRGRRRKRSTDGAGDSQPEPEIVARGTGSTERQKRDDSNAGDRGPEPETVSGRAGRKSRRKRSTNDEASQKLELETTGSEVQQRAANTAVVRRRRAVWRLTGSRRRRRRSSDVADPHGGPSKRRRSAEVASSVESAGGIDHADLHSRLVAGSDHEPGAALARRTKMFVEIRKRHRLQLAAGPVRGDDRRTDVKNVFLRSYNKCKFVSKLANEYLECAMSASGRI